MRLHELAKDLGAESKLLLKLAQDNGLKVKNHSSTLAPGEIGMLKALWKEEHGDKTAAAAAPAVAAEPEPAPADKTGVGRTPRIRSRTAKAAEPAPEEVASDDGDVALEPEVDTEETVVAEDQDGTTFEVAEPAVDVEAAPPAPAAETAPRDSAETAAPAKPAPEPTTPHAPPAMHPTPEVRGPARVHRPAASGPAGPVAGAPPSGPSVGTAPGAPGAPGKPTPTIRRRIPTGAKIVGKIELPPEEIQRRKEIEAGAGGPAQSRGGISTGGPGAAIGDETDAKGGAGAKEKEDRHKGIVKGRQEVVNWNPEDEDDPLLQSIKMRAISGVHARRPPRRVGPRRTPRKQPAAAAKAVAPIEVQCPISLRDLSSALGLKTNDILRTLLGKGIDATVNSALDENAVLEIATAFNREVNISAQKSQEEQFLQADSAKREKQKARRQESGSTGEPRPPVVAFLGHVDHGKTSLLDKIRSTNVAGGEAGGITQSMRAYSVTTPNGHKITFLDTPGHKAFTEMRARGATVTDIVVLVVAADDGVMPQTEEAVQHAKAAGVPIVIALNKTDRAEANPDKVLQQLASIGVQAEEWGGEVQSARVSAVTGKGIDQLLEKLALQAEIMDLRADPSHAAKGTVIEARKDDKLGPIATLLVQDGTLKVGDVVLSGSVFGRVRALIDDRGNNMDIAPPSTPVNVVGLNAPPDASEKFFVVESLKEAREVAAEREHAERQQRVGATSPANAVTLENLFQSLEAGKTIEVKIVLKCDVKGSLEVLRRQLAELATKEIKLKVIRDALGGITEDDVLLAEASKGLVLGFNVTADEKARALAETRGVDVRSYQIIYELLDDVKKAMEGLLSPVKRESVIGNVEIKEIFKVSKVGNIAGCRVTSGVIRRNSQVRLVRDGRIVHTGGLESLRRIKEDVREVKEGLECGLKLAGYDDIKPGDRLEVIEVAEEKRTLDFSAGV